MSTNGAGRRSSRLTSSSEGAGASPEFKKKRRRSASSDSQTASKKQAMSDEGQKQIMAAIGELNRRFDDVPSRRDINQLESDLVRVAPDCNRSYCEDSFSGYSGSV